MGKIEVEFERCSARDRERERERGGQNRYFGEIDGPIKEGGEKW